MSEAACDGTQRQGDSAAGFSDTALIIGGTSDFVPHWQMVGWGGIQGGRFTSIVQAQQLHKETLVSVRGQENRVGRKKKTKQLFFSTPDDQEGKLILVCKNKYSKNMVYFGLVGPKQKSQIDYVEVIQTKHHKYEMWRWCFLSKSSSLSINCLIRNIK